MLKKFNVNGFKSFNKKIAKFQNLSESILFIHIKEPKEIERVVKRFNAKTLLINGKDYQTFLFSHKKELDFICFFKICE